MQPLQRLHHQPQLIDAGLQARQVAAGQGRPVFLHRLDASARLRQHGRVIQAEARLLVVHRLVRLQAPGAAHGGECRRVSSRARGCQGTEKQQVLRQALGNERIAARQRRVLQQHARGRALDVGVDRQRARQGLEKAGAQLPEHGRMPRRRAARQSPAHGGQLGRRVPVGVPHDLEHAVIHAVAHRRAVRQGLRRWRQLRVGPAPGVGPQVGRVNAVGAGQLLDLAKLREQAQRRTRVLAQLALDKFDQRKTGFLERGRSRLRAGLRLRGETLGSRFHAAHHLRRHGLPHHVERAGHLVQLLPRRTQLAGIDRGQVDPARMLGLMGKTPQRLGGRLDRLARFIKDPGQRPQVARRHGRSEGVFSEAVGDHGSMHSNTLFKSRECGWRCNASDVQSRGPSARRTAWGQLISVIHGVARHPQPMRPKAPEGRGAGHASDRRGRGIPGQERCPRTVGGETSRSE